MDNKKPLIAHLSILTACVIWGLMSPVGKSAMAGGIDGRGAFGRHPRRKSVLSFHLPSP